jgi:acyl-CoA-binding protein
MITPVISEENEQYIKNIESKVLANYEVLKNTATNVKYTPRTIKQKESFDFMLNKVLPQIKLDHNMLNKIVAFTSDKQNYLRSEFVSLKNTWVCDEKHKKLNEEILEISEKLEKIEKLEEKLVNAIILSMSAYLEFTSVIDASNHEPAILSIVLNEFFNAIAHIIILLTNTKEREHIKYATNHFCKMAKFCYTFLIRFAISAKLATTEDITEYQNLRKDEYLTSKSDILSIICDYWALYILIKNSKNKDVDFKHLMTQQYSNFFKQSDDPHFGNTKKSFNDLKFFMIYFKNYIEACTKITNNHDPYFADRIHELLKAFKCLMEGQDANNIKILDGCYNSTEKSYKNNAWDEKKIKGIIDELGLDNFIALYFEHNPTIDGPVKVSTYEFNKIIAHIIVMLDISESTLINIHKEYAKSHIRRATNDFYKLIIMSYFVFIIEEKASFDIDLLNQYAQVRIDETMYFGNKSEKNKILDSLKDLSGKIMNRYQNKKRFVNYLKAICIQNNPKQQNIPI